MGFLSAKISEWSEWQVNWQVNRLVYYSFMDASIRHKPSGSEIMDSLLPTETGQFTAHSYNSSQSIRIVAPIFLSTSFYRVVCRQLDDTGTFGDMYGR